MASKKNRLQQIRGIDATIPADIAGTVLLLVVLDGLVLQRPTAVPLIRAAIGLVVVLFVPGYLAVAALYPRRYSPVDQSGPVRSAGTTGDRLVHGGRPSWWERIALAVGLSLAFVPLSGLVVAPLTGSFSTWSVLLGLNGFVLLGACVALLRRNMVPADERLRIPIREAAGRLASLIDRDSYPDRILGVVLVCTLGIAAVTTGFVLLAPADGETYTTASLLTETADGDLEASGYPETLVRGNSEPLTLRVENHEGTDTAYTAVAVLQRVDRSGESLSVTESERVFREHATVEAGETWTARHGVTLTMTGENLRLRYYLYRGEPPANPDKASAYRTLSLWLTVESDG
jgi:uncharacterized membrane protein